MKAVPLLWASLIVTPILITLGQVLFKFAGLRLGEREGAAFVRVLLDPYLLTALGLYGVGTLIWINVLKHLPLATAYPFMAATFILVPVASVLVFGESLGLRYWIGAVLIVAGMAVINS